MKILHITETFAPIGGTETYILGLLPNLARSGHENCVLYRQTHPQTISDPAIEAVHVPYAPDDRQHLVDAITRLNPDVTYLHAILDPALVELVGDLLPTTAYIHDFRYVCPGLAKFYKKAGRICDRAYGLGCVPRIYTQRCATAYNPRSVVKIMRQVKHYLAAFGRLPRLLVASSYMRDLLLQNGMQPERVSIVPHATAMPAQITPLSQDEVPTIVFAGRLVDEKGLHYLLRALATVSAPFKLHIAGDGPQRAPYEALAADLGLAQHVTFLGWIDEAEVLALYKQAAIVAVPAIWPEPFGKVGVDGMGQGRPVIAFATGGIPDWLTDGWNGYLIPPRDTAKMAERLQSLLTDSDLRQAMGANGRRRAEETYTHEQHTQKIIYHLGQLLNS